MVEAMALKPMICSARATAESQGWGRKEQPVSCSRRKLARFSAVDNGIFSLLPRRRLMLVGADDSEPPGAVLARVVLGAAVARCLRAFVHPVIADHAGNTQPVILENLSSPLALGDAMLRRIAPGCDRVLVTEQRQRQYFAGLGQTFEALHRNEAGA